RETDPGERGPGEGLARCDASRQLAETDPHGTKRAETYPDQLARDETDDDTPRDRGGECLAEEPVAQVHPGIREREHGDDHVARPRVQDGLETLVDRDRALEVLPRRVADLRHRRLPECPKPRYRPFDVAAARWTGRDEQARDHAGDRWVAPSLERRYPQRYADQ